MATNNAEKKGFLKNLIKPMAPKEIPKPMMPKMRPALPADQLPLKLRKMKERQMPSKLPNQLPLLDRKERSIIPPQIKERMRRQKNLA